MCAPSTRLSTPFVRAGVAAPARDSLLGAPGRRAQGCRVPRSSAVCWGLGAARQGVMGGAVVYAHARPIRQPSGVALSLPVSEGAGRGRGQQAGAAGAPPAATRTIGPHDTVTDTRRVWNHSDEN